MASTIARILSQLRIPIPVALGGTGKTTADEARASLLIPGRNRIINGDCRVAQRPSLVCSNDIGGFGGPDRFFAVNSSAGGQFTQSAGALVDGVVNKGCITQTVNTAMTDYSGIKYWSGILQRIEGANCNDLAGQPIAVSFLFRASVAGTYSVAVRDGSGTNAYVTTFVVAANVLTKVTINLPAIPAGVSIPVSTASGLVVIVGALSGGSYSTATPNAWISGNYMTAAGCVNWGTTVGASISMTELQLEGGTATPFERRTLPVELALCQRYCEYVTSIGTRAYVLAATPIATHVQWKVTKRVTPTVTKVGTWTYSNGANPNPNYISNSGCYLQGTGAATGDTLFLADPAQGAYLVVEAEL